MKRAGIVLGYEHVCRKAGCKHSELAADAEVRRCPVHKMKLWPKASVRQVRFHDLRHTTASLLMMAGANTAAVQRILRHKDPRITTEVYGHLAPGYLRSEIDRLRFFPDSEPEVQASEEPAAMAVGAQLGPMVVQEGPEGASASEPAITNRLEKPGIQTARHRGFELRTCA
jgi:hypothetical protein